MLLREKVLILQIGCKGQYNFITPIKHLHLEPELADYARLMLYKHDINTIHATVTKTIKNFQKC